MKLDYDAKTDSLYVQFAQAPSVDSSEVSPGVTLDFDGKGNVVGIDFEHASAKVDLKALDAPHFPLM